MKISVVIPAYNAASYIEKAVSSAWDQTVEPYEVIVADDGSTDNTAELAEAKGARVLRLPRGNVNKARNAGVRAATGDVIAFCDADDWFWRQKIEAHLEVHESGNWSFVVDPATMVDMEGRAFRLCGPPVGGPVPFEKFTCRTYWYGGSSFSVCRDKLAAIDGWREDLPDHHDIDLWLRLGHAFGAAYVMNQSHTSYLQTPNSLSRREQLVLDNLKVLIPGLPFLAAKDRRRLTAHAVFSAADHTPFPKSLPLLAHVWYSLGDPRGAKSLARSIKLAVNQRRK